jgi:hypothetical protein
MFFEYVGKGVTRQKGMVIIFLTLNVFLVYVE